MNHPDHSSDADCAPYLDDTETCTVCGVDHSDECFTCLGRGFHKNGCPVPERYEYRGDIAFVAACAVYRRHLMKVTVPMALARETKGALRYEGVIGVLYIRKDRMKHEHGSSNWPQKIEVSITTA